MGSPSADSVSYCHTHVFGGRAPLVPRVDLPATVVLNPVSDTITLRRRRVVFTMKPETSGMALRTETEALVMQPDTGTLWMDGDAD